jgi:hypothetical protein
LAKPCGVGIAGQQRLSLGFDLVALPGDAVLSGQLPYLLD